MTDWTTLPHENLIAYKVARELLVAVAGAEISNAALRDQALRAARSACLNIAEGAGRASGADKARVYSIARGEACEAVAAMDIAAAGGDCSIESAQNAGALARRVYALLTALIRSRQNSNSGRAKEPRHG